MAADFEVRQLDLAAARKLYGTALGMCPKERIFKAYLKLETSLANYDRARKIYEKYLETMPFNCSAWSSVRVAPVAAFAAASPAVAVAAANKSSMAIDLDISSL